MPKKRFDVFISSTSIDLPEHRQAVINALLGIGLFPSGMEHWPVADENPVDLCRQKIEEAEIYVGIYAHRYGWRPDGPGTKSITELEYEWATELGIPRYCFIMDDEYPWPRKHMELDALDDLDAFKARVKQQVVGFFTDPNDLKAQVVQALAPYAQKQDLGVVEPYLRRLHYEAMQSGLLRTLDSRTKDPAFQDRHVTVDQVYTPLNMRTQVFRDDTGKIEWDVRAMDREKMPDRDVSPLKAMEAASYFPHLVILGDPGSGKSTFVGFLALGLTGHWLDPEAGWLTRLHEQGWVQPELLRKQGWDRDALLPVQVILRDFAQDMGPEQGTVQSLLDHIGRRLAECGCPDALGAVKQAMHDGRALLILDGLDEVPADRRTAVRDAVQMLIQTYDRCRVLITCRILSYANPEWQIPSVGWVTLAPFDEDQIQHFIRAWYTASESIGSTDPATAQARIADLSAAVADRQLRDMASNPMLLTVMAIVHNHRGSLPRETARLYHECVEILMLRWKPDESRHLREVLELPDETDLYRILWQIAYEAHEQSSSRTGAADIPKSEVIAIAAEYHLGGDYGKAQLFCDYVEERAGLLIGRGGDDHQRRVYAFPHRTFQEYLAGCFIADDVDFVTILDEKAHAGANWRQVVALAAGHMYFNKTDRNQPLLAVQHILHDAPQTDDDWLAAILAGEILLLIGLPTLEKYKLGGDLLALARDRLVTLLATDCLEPVERANAGRILSELGDPRPGVGLREDGLPDIDWVEIPAGEFIYQNGERLTLPTFYISRYPVTYLQFQAFIDAEDGFYNPVWWEGLAVDDEHKRAPGEQAFKYWNHPRENASWYDSVAFCRWLDAKLKALTPWPPLPQGEGEMQHISPDEEEKFRAMARQTMTQIARDLRKQQTTAESVLWECLCDRRLGDIKFRRQHPIAETAYVVDFFSYESNLIVELDGPIHDQQHQDDFERQRHLEHQGYRVIRFTNEQVFDDLETVLVQIVSIAHSVEVPLPEGEGLRVRADWEIRLPTEQEWEKAARGTDGRLYPWGNQYISGYANIDEIWRDIGPNFLQITTAVGSYPRGTSSYRVLDLAGNVWEWCLNEYDDLAHTDLTGDALRVLRGGSWNNAQVSSRNMFRLRNSPGYRFDTSGFRLVRSPR